MIFDIACHHMCVCQNGIYKTTMKIMRFKQNIMNLCPMNFMVNDCNQTIVIDHDIRKYECRSTFKNIKKMSRITCILIVVNTNFTPRFNSDSGILIHLYNLKSEKF